MTNHDILAAQAQHVVMKNELIQNSRYSLGLLEQRALLYIVSKIKPTDEPYQEYPFSIEEFCRVCNFNKDSGTYYQYVKNIIKEMKSKPLVIKIDEHKELVTNWINDAVLDDETGIVSISFSKYLTPYLFELRQFYTIFSLEDVLAMKSKYGIRLYEYLKSVKSLGWKHTITISDLRDRIGCNDKYTDYKDFKKYALEPALKDINTYTGLNVAYKANKYKKKVVSIEFTILTANTPEEATKRHMARRAAIEPD